MQGLSRNSINGQKHHSCTWEMNFHYKPTPEYQRPLQGSVSSEPVHASHQKKPRQTQGLTWADLAPHTSWDKLEQFCTVSWILTAIQVPLCIAGCKRILYFGTGCCNTLPNTLSFKLCCEQWWKVTNGELQFFQSFWPVKIHQVLHLHEHLMGTVIQQLIWFQIQAEACSALPLRGWAIFTYLFYFINLSFPLLLRAPNHCPGWQPWKPQESKWYTLTNFHGI